MLGRDDTDAACPFEVFALPSSDAFYVETGSACHSGCCDERGLSFSGGGKRLDDGIVDRWLLRLGTSGLASIVIGALCLPWALGSRARLVARFRTALGFVYATALPWWNH